MEFMKEIFMYSKMKVFCLLLNLDKNLIYNDIRKIRNYPQRFKALTSYDVESFIFSTVKKETLNIHPKPINSYSLRLTSFFILNLFQKLSYTTGTGELEVIAKMIESIKIHKKTLKSE